MKYILIIAMLALYSCAPSTHVDAVIKQKMDNTVTVNEPPQRIINSTLVLPCNADGFAPIMETNGVYQAYVGDEGYYYFPGYDPVAYRNYSNLHLITLIPNVTYTQIYTVGGITTSIDYKVDSNKNLICEDITEVAP